nr:glycoside hydrolase family 15 protein [Candidatus Levybacteria bacterium]
ITTHDISSVYGIFKFKVLPINDPILEKAVEIAREKLTSSQSKYGIARYEGDQYYNSTNYHPGNPWIISSLWIAQYEIAKAKSKKDLSEKVLPILDWVVSTANPAGILPEQVNPYTNEQLSASPLTWSHAEYIVTTIQLLQKYKLFEQTRS